MILDHPSINDAAQADPAWQAWSDPAAVAAQVERLFTETLPGVPNLVPLPDTDRYSRAVLTWMTDPFQFLFPDENALISPERASVVEQFVCYLGEWLRHNAGGVWFAGGAGPEGSALAGMVFTPSIAYPFTRSIDDLTDLMFQAVESEDGTDFNMTIAADLYSRTVEYAEYHGIPHELDAYRHNLI